MIDDLVDGTYELFRHFYGLRRFTQGHDKPLGAVAGVLTTLLQMLEQGSTHVGVATDHVIESFRNELWSGYKTGDGIEPALLFKRLATLRTDAAVFAQVCQLTEREQCVIRYAVSMSFTRAHKA